MGSSADVEKLVSEVKSDSPSVVTREETGGLEPLTHTKVIRGSGLGDGKGI